MLNRNKIDFDSGKPEIDKLLFIEDQPSSLDFNELRLSGSDIFDETSQKRQKSNVSSSDDESTTPINSRKAGLLKRSKVEPEEASRSELSELVCPLHDEQIATRAKLQPKRLNQRKGLSIFRRDVVADRSKSIEIELKRIAMHERRLLESEHDLRVRMLAGQRAGGLASSLLSRNVGSQAQQSSSSAGFAGKLSCARTLTLEIKRVGVA